MEYTSTFVRYERRGDRVVPVRVTKSWVSHVGRSGSSRRFVTTRVSELRRIPNGDREAAPEGTFTPRVETRDRLKGLVVRYDLAEGGEPVLVDPTDRPTLGIGDPSTWTRRQVDAPMEAEPESREWFLRRQWAELRGYEDEEDEVTVMARGRVHDARRGVA